MGRRPKPPSNASCSCISCSPTGCPPRGEVGRRPASGRSSRPGTSPLHGSADLTVQLLDHVVGTDARPMLAWEVAVGQRFLCTIFSDIVCCLLSEWCVVTSFYQSLHAMSSFMRFSICATYCTLSLSVHRVHVSAGATITRHCLPSMYIFGRIHLCDVHIAVKWWLFSHYFVYFLD